MNRNKINNIIQEYKDKTTPYNYFWTHLKTRVIYNNREKYVAVGKERSDYLLRLVKEDVPVLFVALIEQEAEITHLSALLAEAREIKQKWWIFLELFIKGEKNPDDIDKFLTDIALFFNKIGEEEKDNGSYKKKIVQNRSL